MNANDKHSSLFSLFASNKEKSCITLTTGVNVIKLFQAKIAKVFVHGEPFEPGLIFAGEARSLGQDPTLQILDLAVFEVEETKQLIQNQISDATFLVKLPVFSVQRVNWKGIARP